MNLESQVVSLELAKRLKDLGVEQDGLFSFVKLPNDVISIWRTKDLNNVLCAAFTVAELINMLQKYEINIIISPTDENVANILGEKLIVLHEKGAKKN